MTVRFETSFSEDTEPLAQANDSPPPGSVDEIKAQVLGYLRSNREPLYALVDGARADRVVELLREHAILAGVPDAPAEFAARVSTRDTVYQSLYLESQLPEIAEHGPYIVQLPKNSPLLPLLIVEGWGQSWGVFVASTASFADVRRHFRHFLLVRHPDGDSILFRFFDPRVLRSFLPACTSGEITLFFAGIEAILCEAERGKGILRYTASQGAVACRIPLAFGVN